MIFDLVYIIDKCGKFSIEEYNIQKLSNYSEDFKKFNCISFKKQFNNILISGYFRNKLEISYKENEECIFIIVGELMLRTDVDHNLKGKFIDVNVLSDLIKEYPDSYKNKIKGNFQIIIHQKISGETILINSQGGVSPIYYKSDTDVLIITTALYLLPVEIRKSFKVYKTGVLEYIIFNYPLGKNTLVEEVYNLQAGEMIEWGKDFSMSSSYYFDIKNLIEREKTQFDDEYGIGLFTEITNNMMSDKDKYTMSLTGGFDCRANLSVANVDYKNILFYSFGIKGSKNIDIPIKIAQKLGLNYKPFFLEEEYEEKYDFYAKKMCLLTDCLSTVQRANYPYVFEDLSEFSDVVITGIFGSELLRTFQNSGLMFSEIAFKTLTSGNPIAELENQIINIRNKAIWDDSFFSNHIIQELLNNFKEYYLNTEYGSDNSFIYNYFIKDSLRKYFGGEVHSERIFSVNRFPFFDDEFVEYVINSEYSSLNNKFMSPTYTERLHSQVLYAKIINKTNKGLLGIDTDHGYSPKLLLLPFSLLFIAPGFIVKNFLKKKSGYKEFRSEKWGMKLLKNNFDSIMCSLFINKNTEENFINPSNLQELRKLYSLTLFTKYINPAN